MQSLSPTLEVMRRAAEKAGKRLIRDFGEVEQLQVSRKGPKDFVTAADLKSEEIITAELQKARPDYRFLTEESGDIDGDNHEYRWIVDPLDGTSNFLHSIPHFCISIALEKTVRGKQQIEAGMIFQPITQDIFYAERGKGAYLNNHRIKVSARSKLIDAIIATGNTAYRADDEGYRLLTRDIGREVHAIRSMGSAALDLAFVAAGKYDAYWQRGLKPWDVAAGLLLVQEAGGTIRDMFYQGDAYQTGNMLASNSAVSPSLDKLFATARRQHKITS